MSSAASRPERREVGELVLEGVPDVPERITKRSYQYQQARSCQLQDWLPGGGILVTTRFADVAQVHQVACPGGDRRQLTFFPEPISSASVCPDRALHDGFLYLKDQGGSEKYQIYYFDQQTGASVLLTDGVSRNGGVSWSNSGTHFAYYSTGRNGQDWDVRIMELAPQTQTQTQTQQQQQQQKVGEIELVTEGGGCWWMPRDWSPDDKKILVKSYVSAADSSLHVVDIATRTRVKLG